MIYLNLLLITLGLAINSNLPNATCGFLTNDDSKVVIHYANGQVQTAALTGACEYKSFSWDVVEKIEIFGPLFMSMDHDGNGNGMRTYGQYGGFVVGQVYGQNEPTYEQEIVADTHVTGAAFTITRVGGHAIIHDQNNYKGERVYLSAGQSKTGFLYKSWQLAPGYSLGNGSKIYLSSKPSINGINSIANVNGFNSAPNKAPINPPKKKFGR